MRTHDPPASATARDDVSRKEWNERCRASRQKHGRRHHRAVTAKRAMSRYQTCAAGHYCEFGLSYTCPAGYYCPGDWRVEHAMMPCSVRVRADGYSCALTFGR